MFERIRKNLRQVLFLKKGKNNILEHILARLVKKAMKGDLAAADYVLSWAGMKDKSEWHNLDISLLSESEIKEVVYYANLLKELQRRTPEKLDIAQVERTFLEADERKQLDHLEGAAKRRKLQHEFLEKERGK